MTLSPCHRGGLLALLVALLVARPAPATTIDTRPRPAILLVGSGWLLAQDRWDGVALYDAADGRLLRRFLAGGRVNAIDATADEGLLLVGCADGGVAVWDIGTGGRLWRTSGSGTGLGYVYDVSFARDGRSCVVCGNGGNAVVYEARTGRQVAKVGFRPGETSVMSACLSPDGSRGALVDLGERLFTFDVGTGALRDTGLTGAWPVRCSADGECLACRSANSGSLERLRAVALGTPPAVRDVGEFACIGHIRPVERGGFLVTLGPRPLRVGRASPAWPSGPSLPWSLSWPSCRDGRADSGGSGEAVSRAAGTIRAAGSLTGTGGASPWGRRQKW